jgi:hypothetical protein
MHAPQGGQSAASRPAGRHSSAPDTSKRVALLRYHFFLVHHTMHCHNHMTHLMYKYD